MPCLFCLPVYYSDCYLDYDSCCLPRPSSLFIDSTCLPPAPTFCPSSDLYFVLSTVVNKLQMDHQTSDSSQKTSPQSDPAALTQLTFELSAQANQLAIHQHQLTRLTTLTEELVRTLQGLSLSPPAPAQPPKLMSP